MKTAALIVAAGRGTRLGSETPKQYLPLNGKCALRRSVELFLGMEEVDAVLVAIHPDDAEQYDAAVQVHSKLLDPVHGGETRAATVRAGLEALAGAPPDAVLIHDAARPFMPTDVVRRVMAALETTDGACAALPVVDALWRADGSRADRPVSRDGLWRAQTPQGFRFAPILAAHRGHGGDGADDVAVAREAGLVVTFVEGSEAGYKITTAADLARARRDVGEI